MLHYVFQVAWCCLLGMSSIFSALWPVATAKNHPSFLPTTLSDQTIVIDITLVIFTKHLMANLKGLVFSLIFWVVETQMSHYWDWDYIFEICNPSPNIWCHGFQRKLSLGVQEALPKRCVHGVFFWGEKVSVAENQRHHAVWNMNMAAVLNIFYFHLYLGKWLNLTIIFFKRVETTNYRWRLVFFFKVYEVLYRKLGPTEEPLKNKAAVCATK